MAISHISINEVQNQNMLSVRSLNSVEDVATLIEVFENYLSEEMETKNIVDVVENNQGNYFFVVDSACSKEDFDFYGFINSKYKGIGEVNCVNAKLMFPKGNSRGLFTGQEISSSVDADEEVTGYIDETELDNIVHGNNSKLLYKKLNVTIPITDSGVIIGRSASKSEYVVSGNNDISREHARVFKQGNTYYIEDLNSRNGTYVDGLKIYPHQKKEICEGNIVMLATEEFTIIGG